jgi:feruloyl esterase
MGAAALAVSTGAVMAVTLLPGTAVAETTTGTTTSCADLAGTEIPAEAIGLPSSGAAVESATLVEAAETETGPVPAHCDVRVAIEPVDPQAPQINARVNLPISWNGKATHFGGGGYNGSVPAATGPAPSAPPGVAAPLSRGYVTFASDSGHTGGNARFALNEEALVNFGYAALKKTRDVAVALIEQRYGTAPAYTYFVGSSQGGREALTVAQRFPDDYDGVLSRVPVVPFTALQLAGNRVGAAVAAGGWMNEAEIQLLSDATFAACDARDGIEDGLIADYAGCQHDPAETLCPEGQDPAVTDTCLSPAQVEAVRVVRSALEFEFPLANDVRSYPGWPVGHEAASWLFWIMGATPPPATQDPGDVNPGGSAFPGTSAVGNFGAQWVRYAITQDPNFDTRTFDPNDPQWRERIQEVSEIVDSTDPDLSAFRASGGKLIMQENFGDYAQSPFAGARYFEAVVDQMGARKTAQFARLYASPGADHGGLNAPAQVDWVSILEAWVEHGMAPGDVVMTGLVDDVFRALPGCQYPAWPRYVGGPVEAAQSFTCAGSEPD